MSLNKNNSIVEEALLQMKSIEEAISENAKGILASTMKEEISELVRESLNGSKKESLHEQEEDDELEVQMDDMGMEDMEDGAEEEDMEMDDELGMDDEFDFSDEEEDVDMEMDDEFEMAPLDMTGASPEEVLKVFKAMGDEDGIIVKKDGDTIHLTDNETNSEYVIDLGGELEDIDAMQLESTDDEVIYELIFEEDEDEDEDEVEDDDIEQEDEEDEDEVNETMKPKGIGFGKVKSGMSKTSVNQKGFKEEMPDGTKSEKKGKGPKFSFGKIKHGVTESEFEVEDEEFMEDYTEGWMDEVEMDDTKMEGDYMESDEMDIEMDAETTEASRTIAYKRRAERDRVAAPSQLRKESIEKEMNLLKEKNEEYKKALDFFRNKLNEVAVFNSNLAYSTRLFTEHSTTKQEKINILRRFDNVESIKESKSLYKSIKNELDGKVGEVVSESIQTKVNRTPANGSASNLIESKTYENPQFMRMRDLMSKIN
jgi:hypothetical protein